MTILDTDAGARASRPSPSRFRRHELLAYRLIALVAGVVAAFAGCEPTGTAIIDPLLTGAAAAIFTLASARSRRWPWFAPVVVAVALAKGLVLVPAAASAVTALLGSRARRRSRIWGAATGGLAVQALVRLPEGGFHGLTAIIAGLAVVPVLISGYRACRTHERRRIRLVVAVAASVVIVVGLAYGALILAVSGDVDRGVAGSRTGLRQTRQGETAAARGSFEDARQGFRTAESRLNAWWTAPARAVPVLAQHARALGATADQGVTLATTAKETVEAADYERLRYDDGQFDLARIASVEAPLGRTAESISSARRAIEVERSPWLLWPLSDGLDEFDEELDQAGGEAELARQAVEVAPGLLGGDGLRRYFVAFVTPSELRGSGGFIGSYAELTADDGRLRLTRSGAVKDLEAASPPGSVEITGPEPYLARYGRFDPGNFIRDITFSPHFPYDADVLSQVYPQSGGAPVDGVISIDPIALAELLRFTGPIPVEAFGRTLTADTAAEFLLNENYSLFPDDAEQTDALSELTETAFDRLTTGDLPGPRELSRVLGPVTQAGRIRLWSPQPAEQALFERIDATGAFPPPRADTDFFAIATQNVGNNKIDYYQRRDLDYRVRLGDAGTVEATATITIHNDAPSSGLPPYVIGNSQGDPPGTNLMSVSVYSPHALESANLEGLPIGMASEREAGYRVYEKQVSVPPGGSVTLELRLVGALDVSGDYRLALAPQPTVNPDKLAVTVAREGAEAASRGPLTLLEQDEIVLRERE